MSARTEHPLAHVLRWIADGLDVQTRCDFGNGIVTDWRSVDPNDLLAYIRSIGPLWQYRLAPAQVAQVEFLPELTEFKGVQS